MSDTAEFLSAAKNAGADVIDAVWQGFVAHAQNAAGDIRDVLLEAAKDAGELGRDFAGGKVTWEQLVDSLRKLELTAESRTVRITRAEAKKYIMTVIQALAGGAVGLLGAFKIKS